MAYTPVWKLLGVFIAFYAAQGQNIAGTPQSGSIVLIRNGLYSQSYTSGRVVVYGVGSPTSSSRFWGNICRLSSFNLNAANVICHQLTYSGASLWSYAAVDSFGIDNRNTLLDDVSCSRSSYLMLFQCSVSTFISSSCTDSNDISVTCYTTRIWNSPVAGQIRLSQGNFTNEGLIEIYCNNQWGTVCDNTFTTAAATIVCKELGYNQYYAFNNLALVGTSSQAIWLNRISCNSSTNCLSSCQGCSTARVTTCVHAEDVTITCYSSSTTASTSHTQTSCPAGRNADGSDDTGALSGGAIAGIVVASIIGVGLVIGFLAHLDKKKKQREAAARHAARVNNARTPAPAVVLTSVSPQEPATVQPPPPVYTQEQQNPPPAASTPRAKEERNPIEEKLDDGIKKPPPPPYEVAANAPPVPLPYNPDAPQGYTLPYPTAAAYPTAYPPPVAAGYYPPSNPYPANAAYPPATYPAASYPTDSAPYPPQSNEQPVGGVEPPQYNPNWPSYPPAPY